MSTVQSTECISVAGRPGKLPLNNKAGILSNTGFLGYNSKGAFQTKRSLPIDYYDRFPVAPPKKKKVTKKEAVSESTAETVFSAPTKDESQETFNSLVLKEKVRVALMDKGLDSVGADATELLQEGLYLKLKEIIKGSIEISRKRQAFRGIYPPRNGCLVTRVHPVVFNETKQPFDLLSVSHVYSTMQQLEKHIYQVETSKRKASLEKMKKEEELRGKSKRTKERNPRLEALKARFEKEAETERVDLELENTKKAIQCFLSPDPIPKHRAMKKANGCKVEEKSKAEIEEEKYVQNIHVNVYESDEVEMCGVGENAQRKIMVKDLVHYMEESQEYSRSKLLFSAMDLANNP